MVVAAILTFEKVFLFLYHSTDYIVKFSGNVVTTIKNTCVT